MTESEFVFMNPILLPVLIETELHPWEIVSRISQLLTNKLILYNGKDLSYEYKVNMIQ